MKLGRKITGGKIVKRRKKKSYESKEQRKTVKLSQENKVKKKRVRGGNSKAFMLRAKTINVVLKKGGKAKKVEIKNVIETPSNRFLARQNIITKGTVIETSEGKVRVTNRPTQEGTLNGVLISE